MKCTEPYLEALASKTDPQLLELAGLLQTTYQRDRKISNTLRGDIFQCLGHMIEAAPMVRSDVSSRRAKFASDDTRC